MDEFEVAAYSNVATHRHRQPIDLDIARIKKLAIDSWSLTGVERLVKLLAAIRHDNSWTPICSSRWGMTRRGMASRSAR
jgi:hypothetical protein